MLHSPQSLSILLAALLLTACSAPTPQPTALPPTATPLPTPTATPLPEPTATSDKPTTTATPPPEPTSASTAESAPTAPGADWTVYSGDAALPPRMAASVSIAVPPGWWCVDYDPQDKSQTLAALGAGLGDQFGVLAMTFDMMTAGSSANFFYCVTGTIDEFIASQSTDVQIFSSTQSGYTHPVDLLAAADDCEIAEMTLSSYPAASSWCLDAALGRYDLFYAIMVGPTDVLHLQFHTLSTDNRATLEAIAQTVEIAR